MMNRDWLEKQAAKKAAQVGTRQGGGARKISASTVLPAPRPLSCPLQPLPPTSLHTHFCLRPTGGRGAHCRRKRGGAGGRRRGGRAVQAGPRPARRLSHPQPPRWD